jgi:hypothetical protein
MTYDERFPANNCQQNARWMSILHPGLSVVEGYLVFTERDGTEFRTEHAWNETAAGTVVDSTAWAFKDDALPCRYERDPGAWPRFRAQVEALRGAS